MVYTSVKVLIHANVGGRGCGVPNQTLVIVIAGYIFIKYQRAFAPLYSHRNRLVLDIPQLLDRFPDKHRHDFRVNPQFADTHTHKIIQIIVFLTYPHISHYIPIKSPIRYPMKSPCNSPLNQSPPLSCICSQSKNRGGDGQHLPPRRDQLQRIDGC